MPIPDISTALAQLADEKSIRILYACESGSRAWGFASPDSDYDVRFIFAYPQEKYLSVRTPSETIERLGEHDLDLVGWDLRKALSLVYKCNASPLEWLQSPMEYQAEGDFRSQLWELAQGYFQPVRLIHHYLGVMQSAYQSGVAGEQIKLKKYFYRLRPLLAARWVVERNQVPPMVFSELLSLPLPEDVRSLIDELLAQKAQASEGATIPLIPTLETYLASASQACLTASQALPRPKLTHEPLDRFFRQWL